MKNILKLLSVFLLIPLVFNSCRDDADRDWKTADASFKLYNTTLTSNVLYPTMDQNPFRLTWDNTIGASSYDVVYSTTSDFKNKIKLGTTNKNSFTTTIGALNTALLQANYSPYQMSKVYFRIEAGTQFSNPISFDVTPYPVTVPVVTNPTASTAVVMDKDFPDDAAISVLWNDYNTYGVNVNYLVEVSKKGDNNFVFLGNVMNLRVLDASNKALNDAALKAGLSAGVQGELDLRVTAITKSVGGTINKVSDIVTFKVTPYTAYKFLYLIGDATPAGWDNNATNAEMHPLFVDASNTNIYHYTGYFKAGGLKLVGKRGSWDEQYGYKSDGVLAANDGGSGNIPVPANGYYTLTVNTTTNTYSLVAYTNTSTIYDTIGLIGGFNSWSGDLALTQSSVNPHIWYTSNVTLPVGILKFRANGSWDINWGSATAISGQGTQGGDNIPVNESGNYNVYFNDIDGRYIFIKQ